MHAQRKTEGAKAAGSTDLPRQGRSGNAQRRAVSPTTCRASCRPAAQPGARYRTRSLPTRGSAGSDCKHELRGIALRIRSLADEQHDLRHHFRFQPAAAPVRGLRQGDAGGTMTGLRHDRPAFRLGRASWGGRQNVSTPQAARVEPGARAMERGAMRLGPELAVRFSHAAKGTRRACTVHNDPDYLSRESPTAVQRRRAFELAAAFVDEKTTPIEDTGVEWTEQASPPITSRLCADQRTSPLPTHVQRRSHRLMGFNPWTRRRVPPAGQLPRAAQQATTQRPPSPAYAGAASRRCATSWPPRRPSGCSR